MKKMVYGILVLMTGAVAAQAAIVVNLENGSKGPATVFTYSNLAATATFDGGALEGTTLVQNTITGASGAFTVAWSAADQSTPADGSTWTFGPPAKIHPNSSGWGVESDGESGGARQLAPGEAILLAFDVSGLTLDPGKVLVFAAATASNESYNVYQRTGPGSGDLVASVPLAPAWSTPITVGGLLEFAITDPGVNGGGNNRLTGFAVDVADAPPDPGVSPPVNLTASAANTLVQLGWNDDPSATLDYYNVYRSIESGTNYVLIASNLAASAYADSAVVNDTTYFYVATAVDTNGTETGFSSEASATPVIPVPTGMAVSSGAGFVTLTWDASADALFSSFSVYRSTTQGTNYAEIAAAITTNAYTDTNVVSDATYYYVVTHKDISGDESAYSAEVVGEPTSALIITELTEDLQAEIRAPQDLINSNYFEYGFDVRTGRNRIGEFNVASRGVARYVMKFPLTVADLGGKPPSSIDRVLLRIYAVINNLTYHTNRVDLYASEVDAADTAVTVTDFENTNYTRLGTFEDITSNSAELVWYEFDVTDTVLADLANDVPDASAGSCFRLQLTGDTLLDSFNNAETNAAGDNIGTAFFSFGDNADNSGVGLAAAPQLKISFSPFVPEIVDIQVDPIPEPDQVVVCWSSLSSLTYRVSSAADLTSGSWDLLVTNLPGLEPVTYYTTDVLTAVASYQVAAELPTPPDALLDEDFEGGANGWTASAAGAGTTVWELGMPTVNVPGLFILTNAFSGTNCWGTDLDGQYQQGTDITITSPTVDLAGVTSAMLSWYESRDLSGTDQGQVWVTDLDTATSTNLHVSSNTEQDWTEVSKPLPAEFMGHKVQIQFRLLDDNVADPFYYGWYIDDVVLTPL